MKKRLGIAAIAALTVIGTQAAVTTNLLVKFGGSLDGTTYTLGAGEVDTTTTFGANGAPTTTNILGETHADLNGGSDGFKVDPSSLGDLTASNWVAEAAVAFQTFGGGQLTVIDVQGDVDFRLNNGGEGLEARYWDGATDGNVSSGLPPELNFIHMALVWDPAASSLTAYTNGVSIGTIDNEVFSVADANNLSFGYLGRSGFDDRGIDGLLHAVSFATSDAAITPANFLVATLPPNPPPTPPAPPVWLEDPIAGVNGFVGVAYSDTLAGKAEDPNDDLITYSRDGSGPAWLIVDPDGTLSGEPTSGDVGTNTFVVVADDEITGATNAVLNIFVSELADPDIVLIDNTTRNGSFEDETGKININEGGVSSWETWTEVATAFNDTGAEDANLGNTYVGLDGDRIAYLQGGAAILNMTTHIIKVGDVIDYSVWSANAGRSPANIELVWDNAGTRTAITGTQVQAATGAQGIGQYTVLEGDPWVGSTLGVGITPDSSWPEIDQVALGVTPKPSAPVTDLAISGPVSGGTGMVLSWTSESGAAYTVKTNSSLVFGEWQPFMTGIPGDGGSINITNTIGPDQTFYRVDTE